MVNRLVCLDMDRVLVDHLSTWQFVYDGLGISNDESFELYNQGLLDEWAWIKLDLALIKSSTDAPISDARLRGLMDGMPLMKGWKILIQHLLDHDVAVAIVSGGLQKTARDIAACFPSDLPWTRRWGGIDRHTANELCGGNDTRLHVFTNGWLMDAPLPEGGYGIGDYGRYQVQMDGKGAIVKMLQRRLNVTKSNTASVGDSMGDVGMFEESACSILFNPWDDRPREHARYVIEERNLELVLQQICDSFGLPKP
jgi:phosphoserine phosphatase